MLYSTGIDHDAGCRVYTQYAETVYGVLGICIWDLLGCLGIEDTLTHNTALLYIKKQR